MRKLYDFVLTNFKWVFAALILLLIPDIFFPKIIVVHLAVIVFLLFLMAWADANEWYDIPADDWEFCRFCEPGRSLPVSDGYQGFAVMGNRLYYDDPADGWVNTEICYCPMCGRRF